jgi:superfamily II DNA or RNA helicase
MITFKVGNILTWVDDPNAIIEPISKWLTIKSNGFRSEVDWATYHKTGKMIRKPAFHQNVLHLFNFKEQTFPTGRLGYVLDWCKENSVEYQAFDVRIKPSKSIFAKYIGPPADGSNGKPPRPYQANAPKVVEEAGGRGILWHATASGKTMTAARIMANFGVKTLYMVPSLELLNQASEDLLGSLEGAKIGKIGEGSWEPGDFTVATPATLWSRFNTTECKDFLQGIEMIIVDELHHIALKDSGKTANSWYTIAINSPAYYRIGMTGTPGKDIETKRALLESACGRVISRISTKELIDMNIVSDVQVNIHKMKHETTYPDYNDARSEGILKNQKFNEYIVQLTITELKAGKSVLIVTNSKSLQGPLLVKLFKDAGYDIPFVSGDNKRKFRKRIRIEFKSGKIRALIGTVYKEGVDFPSLDSGVLADGGKDEKRTIQFLGRILRKAEGKGIAQLHDFFHYDKKHLKKHSQERLNAYIEEDLEKIVHHEGITV